MNERTNACSRRDYSIKVPTSLWSLDVQGPHKTTQKPHSSRLRKLSLGVFVCPAFPHPQWSQMCTPAGRLNLQTGCLCWRPGYLLPRETTGGHPLLPNPLECPAKLKIIGYPRLRDSSSCPRRAAQDIPMLLNFLFWGHWASWEI